ncbi:MAG: hypothetical protein A2087_12035 [Spirochaetes bacterium GWD1_61_31]|nr:MAG: hypothetical protein A2Y37_11140 [Spirochaetes bacterium GWB1_60_80]OHD35331.1 MAG: hypothetical protein A2004_00375 [Spirochaetes bacterium GWC1_61_12]OHD43671.1 MAG: hypothetical protein A2087_12035 [Spirochaetes bacterium GWD1_61_31]OHD44987.1 MAG: hypothetical protein A2Y35_13185 [Spirochaetes bacterium GWE1_60_18]OHD60096.1 MAG: hypothetical protein A2Y32_11295 [Spirochaetes bacterium GWF1_60_12]
MSNQVMPLSGSNEALGERRQQVMDTLTEAFAQGYLDMEAYEKRVDQANDATLPATLDHLVLDLPTNLHVAKPAAAGRRSAARATVSSVVGTNTDIVGMPRMNTACIMSERHLDGNWLQSDKVSTFTVMGSTKLDFTEVDLPPGPTHVEVFTVMGEVKLIVPADVPVNFGVAAIMGEARVEKNVNRQVRGATSWLEVKGLVVMGEVRVRQG